MKRILIYMLLLIAFSELYSQGLINNGAKIIVGSGAYLEIVGSSGNILNTTNVTNESILLDGTVIVQGNIINNATAAVVINPLSPTSTVILSGPTAQTLSGSSTVPFVFQNLTINNPAGVSLLKDINVKGVFTLSNGLINLGSNNLILDPTATIGGTPSATNMIVATGTGQVQKLLTGIGSFTFPIGDNNGTAKYSPVTLNFTAGTFAAGAATGVNVVNAKYNDPFVTGSYLNRYWNVTQTGITAFTCDAMFQYQPVDVVGTESSIKTWKVIPTPFTSYNAANTTLHQMSATGLTALGTFTGGSNNSQLTLKVFLQGLYNTTNNNMNQCQDYVNGVMVNKFAGTISDIITVELHDATTYSTIVYSATGVELNQNGTCNSTGLPYILIPSNYTGSYYITVKTRNHLETTTAAPISFATGTVNYDFTTAAAQAFGSNIVLLNTGVYGVYVGDVNGDGLVNGTDLSITNSSFLQITKGYTIGDINGDGYVNGTDLSTVNGSFLQIIKKQTP